MRSEEIDGPNSQNPKLLYGIRLVRFHKTVEIYTKKVVDHCDLRSVLRRVCIQTDFDEKYEYVKTIGRGTFAKVRVCIIFQVFQVEHKSSKRQFAAKRFEKLILSAQKKGIASLLNEIKILENLNDHPGVMKIFEVQETEDFVYLILELLEGPTLHTYLKNNKGGLDLEDRIFITKSILRVIEYMGSKGIIHRDLKPENIILESKEKPLRDNVMKVVDFGLATFCDVDQYIFTRCGTPGYAAPEIVNAKQDDNPHFTSKCDVFSTGVLLYEM